MIEIAGQLISADIQTILLDLRSDLAKTGIERFNKFIESGRNVQTNCPFHKGGKEKRPSFGVSKSDGTCHCFGCGWSGSLSEMISNCFGKDDLGNYGNKWLLQHYISVSVSERPALDLDLSRGVNVQPIQYITEAELDSYRYTHPYMYKRKLSDEIIEMFDIGYDKATNCITFPVRDLSGNTLFIARRNVEKKFFNYPEGVEKPVYGLYEYNLAFQKTAELLQRGGRCNGKTYALHKLGEIIICESMIDALTCWVYGKYAVALNGLGNDLQFKQLNSMPCRKFILATDMDEAGIKARQRIKKALKNKLVTEYIWDLNVAKDINDMNREEFYALKEVF